MKIQDTNIVEIAHNEACVSLTIANHHDIEQASEYVVLKTYVAHEPGSALETIQLRALDRVAELVAKQAADCKRNLP
jgi:hypothetical protein